MGGSGRMATCAGAGTAERLVGPALRWLAPPSQRGIAASRRGWPIGLAAPAIERSISSRARRDRRVDA